METIQNTLNQDCRLIFEALRRLIEGTCCLEQDEEKLCAWDLFDRMKLALAEHVSFEETWVFPDLPPAERETHRAEHAALAGHLSLASWELECSDGDLFRQHLVRLRDALIRHHSNDPAGRDDCRCWKRESARRDSNLIHINERVRSRAFI